MNMNTLLKTSATAAALGLLLTACGSDEGGAEGNGEGGESYSVAIAQYVAHPSLDATAQGMKDVFEEADADIEVEEQNAHEDQATMNNIVGTYGGDDNVDAVLPIATPAAIAAATSISATTIFFYARSDKVER